MFVTFAGGTILNNNDSINIFVDFASLALILNNNVNVAAQTQNQRAVAGGITNAFSNANLGTVVAPNGAAGAIVTAFNNGASGQVPAILDSISGEGIAGAQKVAYRSSSLFVSSITDQTVFYGAGAANSVMLTDARPNPLAYVATRTPNSPILTRDAVAPLNRTWRAWTTGFGAGENIRGDAGVGTAAQTNSVYGGTLGVDYQFASNYLAGVALGGTDGSFSVGGRNTFGSTTGGHAAFYTLANFGAFYGAGTTSVSFFGNRTTRNIAGFGGLAGETERGNFASREFRSRAEFGWHTGVYGATLTPFVALEIAQLRSNGFTEGALSGAGLLALNVQGQTGASVPGYVGARIARSFLLDNGMVFTPTIQAAYLHEFGPQRTLTAGLVNLPGSTFLVDGARASSNAAQVKAGTELTLTANLRVFANFEGEFSGVEQVYAGKGGLRYSW